MSLEAMAFYFGPILCVLPLAIEAKYFNHT
jgi:hypothetical protein